MTGQGTETKRLPKAIREALPEELQAKTRIYAKDFPAELQRRGLATFRVGARAARGARPARLDPPPVPEVGLPVEREPGADRGRGRAARRLEGRRRVPQRLVAEREERASGRLGSSPSGTSRSSWSTSRRASRARVPPEVARDVVGPRARPVPRPQRRDVGGEGHHPGRALPLPLLARRAVRVGAAHPRGRRARRRRST